MGVTRNKKKVVNQTIKINRLAQYARSPNAINANFYKQRNEKKLKCNLSDAFHIVSVCLQTIK